MYTILFDDDDDDDDGGDGDGDGDDGDDDGDDDDGDDDNNGGHVTAPVAASAPQVLPPVLEQDGTMIGRELHAVAPNGERKLFKFLMSPEGSKPSKIDYPIDDPDAMGVMQTLLDRNCAVKVKGKRYYLAGKDKRGNIIASGLKGIGEHKGIGRSRGYRDCDTFYVPSSELSPQPTFGAFCMSIFAIFARMVVSFRASGMLEKYLDVLEDCGCLDLLESNVFGDRSNVGEAVEEAVEEVKEDIGEVEEVEEVEAQAQAADAPADPPLFRMLTDAENREIQKPMPDCITFDYIQPVNSNSGQPKRTRTEVSRTNLLRILPPRSKRRCNPRDHWVADEAVNAVTHVLKTKLLTHIDFDRDVLICSSYFMEILKEEDGISRTARWYKPDFILNLKKMVVPVNIGNTHWVVACIFIRKAKLSGSIPSGQQVPERQPSMDRSAPTFVTLLLPCTDRRLPTLKCKAGRRPTTSTTARCLTLGRKRASIAGCTSWQQS